VVAANNGLRDTVSAKKTVNHNEHNEHDEKANNTLILKTSVQTTATRRAQRNAYVFQSFIAHPKGEFRKYRKSLFFRRARRVRRGQLLFLG
jgi:hypothetical protein